MKKLFILSYFLFLLSTGLFSQETFFKFTSGYMGRKIYKTENSYITVAINAYSAYNNYLDFEKLSLTGDSITNWRYELDTCSATETLYSQCYTDILDDYAYISGTIVGENTGSLYGFLGKFSSDLQTEIWTIPYILANQSTTFRVIKAKNDTSLILGAYCKNSNDLYTTFLEVDTLGNIRWQKDFDCSGDCNMKPFHILPTQDNGFIFTCYESHINGQPGTEELQTAVIKTDSLGNTQWRHTWGGDTTKNMGSWVVPLDDGNYLYAWTDCYRTGYLGQHNDEGTFRFAKFDINGNIIWYKDMLNHMPQGRSYEISQMELMPDGNIMVSGYIGTEGILIKIDQDANLIWYRELMPPGLSMEENNVYQKMEILGVTFTSDGGFILAGEYFSAPGVIFENGYQSAYAYKLDEYGCYTPGCQIHDAVEEKEKTAEKGFSIYPNPANDFIVIASFVLSEVEGEAKQSQAKTIKIYDLTGEIVKQTPLRGTKQSVQIGDLEKGVYIVRVGKQTKKLIIE